MSQISPPHLAPDSLLVQTRIGWYCPKADVYIDPSAKVQRAVITHAHMDHATPGVGGYFAHHDTIPILRHRLGHNIQTQGAAYGESVNIRGVTFSFHPAGHVAGSAQVRVECDGDVWVVSGDYKVQDDGLIPAFEPVKCRVFITETTFGLPMFQWRDPQLLTNELNDWWRENAENGITSILLGYSLGKSQRLLHMADASIGPLYCGEEVESTNQVIREMGYPLKSAKLLDSSVKQSDLRSALVIAPPQVLKGPLMQILRPCQVGMASGWMAHGRRKSRFGADRGFVISDHADWPGLNWAVQESGAEVVYTEHGYAPDFTRWLRSKGIASFSTEY
ncbi:ligase-associated DNA damage response exonuclease [Pontibacter sp. G13]|uniref:ligase-associated DNA damage response exonuclease n=1 Tax=Pontibacter sp. G13 TaxID=3074898 RepID=UPI00288B4911|nr:ligase-associated DNA damage response exonuclease [Pontibacter sp. G13]WNJ16869.1 ligase-associated DNA damage response exonuclease [Pontibacter sp. G13]